MTVPITVPRLGWSMEEGEFVAWLKHDGDPVRPGDPLFTLQSDKAAQDIEAIDAGVLRLGPDSPAPGARVVVGQVIAHLSGSESNPSPQPPTTRMASRVGRECSSRAAPHGAPGGRVASAPGAGGSSSPNQRRQASTPRARRAARSLGIEWRSLSGTGKGGRVRERDVVAVAGPMKAATQGGQLLPLTPLRRAIAERMLAGATRTAPVTLHAKVDATNLVNLREQFKAAGTTDLLPSYTDLLVKLTAAALHRHPLLRTQWREDGLFVPDRIDIAFAVDTETGLFAPVLRGVDRLGLREVTTRSRELIALARSGNLTGEHLRDATFTLTNLGMHGIDAFTPILCPPQSAVLGVGRIVREAVFVGDRAVPREMLTLSLTFDHRVVDGAPAARFLAAVRQCIEQPAPWLVG